jgi:hypothetical protein
VVTWSTCAEFTVAGFNVLQKTQKGFVPLNDAPIRCLECTTGLGASYAFIVPKHKSGKDIYLEVLVLRAPSVIVGPAVRQ